MTGDIPRANFYSSRTRFPQMRAGGVWRVGICVPDDSETDDHGAAGATTGARAHVPQGWRTNPAPEALLSRTDDRGLVQGEGEGGESEGGEVQVVTTLRRRSHDDGHRHEAWTQDCNWNDRSCCVVHFMYLCWNHSTCNLAYRNWNDSKLQLK